MCTCRLKLLCYLLKIAMKTENDAKSATTEYNIKLKVLKELK